MGRCSLTPTERPNHRNWSEPGQPVQLGVISGVGGVAPHNQTGPRNVRMGVRLEW